jgi:CubicO group peptidase (beta-lactamase class C family)
LHHKYYENLCTGAGGIASNSQDMLKFIDYLFSNKIISKFQLDKMLLSPAEDSNYGYGIEVFRKFDGLKLYGHNGDNIGYASRLYYEPIHNKSISLLFNCSNFELIDFVTDQILDIYFNN